MRGCRAATVIGRTVLLFALLAVAACANGLNFRADHRLHWVSPPQRKLIAVPVNLSWHFDGGAPAEYAIFVDRAPIKPGQTLRAVAGGDRSCLSDPTCPDASYLAERQVYTTTSPAFSLSTVLPLSNDREGSQLHQVTVVLLNSSGHRTGESAWTREFKLKRVTI